MTQSALLPPQNNPSIYTMLNYCNCARASDLPRARFPTARQHATDQPFPPFSIVTTCHAVPESPSSLSAGARSHLAGDIPNRMIRKNPQHIKPRTNIPGSYLITFLLLRLRLPRHQVPQRLGPLSERAELQDPAPRASASGSPLRLPPGPRQRASPP